jgi:hypothetical protein
VKFSVKDLYPISTSLCAANCQASWELAAVGVEYLFMGNGSQINWLIKEDKYDFDFRHLGTGVLNAQPQLNQRSGKYRQKNTVPI